MSKPEDFKIEDGMLVKYTGSDIDVMIPDNVTSIGSNAFAGYRALRSVALSDSVTGIEEYAFSDCGLKRIKISASVKYIDLCAFSDNLEYLIIPETVEWVGNYIFSGPIFFKGKLIDDIVYRDHFARPKNLFEIVYKPYDKKLCLRGFLYCEGYNSESPEVTHSYVRYAKSQRKKLYEYLSEWKNLLYFMISYDIIPASDIDNVFDHIKSDENLTRQLWEYKESKLTEKDFRKKDPNPDSVSELKKVWSYKKNKSGCLIITKYKGDGTNVIVPSKIGNSNVIEIADRAFSWNKSLNTVELPKSIRRLGESVFENCINLVSVNIPGRVTVIGKNMFKGCSQLKSIAIPKSVKEIGWDSFYGCEQMSEISFEGDSRLEAICNHAFFNCKSLKSIIIPDGTIRIHPYAFFGCDSLTKVKLPENLEYLGGCAFWGCPELKEINIPGHLLNEIIDTEFYINTNIHVQSWENIFNQPSGALNFSLYYYSGWPGSDEPQKSAEEKAPEKPDLKFNNQTIAFAGFYNTDELKRFSASIGFKTLDEVSEDAEVIVVNPCFHYYRTDYEAVEKLRRSKTATPYTFPEFIHELKNLGIDIPDSIMNSDQIYPTGTREEKIIAWQHYADDAYNYLINPIFMFNDDIIKAISHGLDGIGNTDIYFGDDVKEILVKNGIKEEILEQIEGKPATDTDIIKAMGYGGMTKNLILLFLGIHLFCDDSFCPAIRIYRSKWEYREDWKGMNVEKPIFLYWGISESKTYGFAYAEL